MGIHSLLKKIVLPLLVVPLLAFLPGMAEDAAAQEIIRGQVLEASTGDPIPGVNVIVQGTSTGTATNLEGEFELSVSSLDIVLTISAVGFETQEIDLQGRDELIIDLEVSAIAIDDVVVVGYGTQRSQDLTGSVGTVRLENLQSNPITSPDQALMGQISGVNVTMPTGVPGGAPQIQVRGVGAVGAGSQPLYVVDGFALPQPSNQAAARFRNPLTDIPPEDIESITVLKDASATAIYGSRASNGVVLITTKSGAPSERAVINVSASSSLQQDIEWMRPDMANARQFAEFQNHVWTGRVASGEASSVPEEYQNPSQYGAGTDWIDVSRRTAYQNEVNVSVSGGNETVSSYISAGVTNQEGVVVGTDFTRFNVRANVDASLSDRISAGIRVAPTFSLRSGSTTEARDGPIYSAVMMSPLQPAFDDNGDVIPYPSQYSGSASAGTWTHANPLYVMENIDDDRRNFRVLGSSYIDLELIDGLVARTSFNIDYAQERQDYFNPSTVGGINNAPPTTPNGSVNQVERLNWLSETTLEYQAELGPGRINALGGFTVQVEADESSGFSGVFPNDNIRTLNVASDIDGFTNEENWSVVSVLGRVNYNLLERYVFTGTLRTDGSSRFGSDNRWGVFPSGAVAWNIHNEAFMSDYATVIPELRLRASYGVTGNNQIGNYAHLGVVSQADYIFGGSVSGGNALTSLANQQLGWERMNEVNLGIDSAFLNHRLGVTVDVYNRNTTQLLLQRSLSTTSGFGSVTENAGTMRNRGIEINVNTVPITTEDVTWAIDFNWSLNRNEVTSLPGGNPIYAGSAEGQPTHITQVGSPIGMHYGFIVDGIYENEADVENYPIFDGIVPGNIRFRDVNGDGEITAGPDGDFAIIGNPHPDFTFGLTSNFSYQNFDFRLNFTGRVGGDIYRSEYWRTPRNIDGLFNVSADYVENFWRSEAEPGDGWTPTPLGGGEARRLYRGQHSLAIYDGSNLWLRSAMVRYNVPQGFLGTRSASIYLSGQNLFVLTGYPGNPDVERNAGQGGAFGALIGGTDWLPYPTARSFTVGIELGF
jgi:TonB-dependent starch-binding outer membrane protein SusC